MTLIMLPFAARAETPFAECTQLAAADERSDVIALAWRDDDVGDAARSVHNGHRLDGVGVYDARSRALLARFHTRYEVNALAFHPTRDELAIATGSYDGGYFFEGELLIWNWRTGASHSELSENREVTQVEWRGDDLLATISPETDESAPGAQAFLLAPARAGERAHQVVTPRSDPRLAPSRGRPVGAPPPSDTFERYRRLVPAHRRVTALDWLADGRVAIGTADDALHVWEPATNRTQQLHVDGQVVAMWHHPDHELLVQVDVRRSSTSLCAIAGDRLELVTSFATSHSCSVDRYGRILARSVDTKKQAMSSVIRDGHIVQLVNLGHFDGANHFIRLDGGAELYFLQGTPPSSYQHKTLCALTTHGDIVVRMPWDDDARHLMSSIGTLVGDGRLARGSLVYKPRGSEHGVIELSDLTGRTAWRHDIECGIAAMAIWQGCVVAGLLDGTFLALELETGKVMHDEPFTFGTSPAMVTAIAVHEEAIALGSIDGRVSIVTSR